MVFFIIPLLLHPKIGLLNPMSITFKLLTLPVIMNVFVWSKNVKFLNEIMGLPIEEDDLSFKGMVSSKVIFWNMLLLNIILAQIFIVPLITFGRIKPMSGKFTFITKIQIPRIMYVVLVTFLLPFIISAVLKDIIIPKEATVKYVTSVSALTLFIGYFISYILKNKLQIVDMVLPIVLTFFTLFSKILKPFVDKLFLLSGGIDLPDEKFTMKTLIENKNNEIAFFFIIFLFWFTMNLAIGNAIPFYGGIKKQVSAILGDSIEIRTKKESDVISFFVTLIAYFIIPMRLSVKFAASFYNKGKNDKEKTRFSQLGMVLGFIIAFLGILVIEMLIPSKVKKLVDKSMDSTAGNVFFYLNKFINRLFSLILFPITFISSKIF